MTSLVSESIDFFSMASRKHGIQSKVHFEEEHIIFIESSEVVERVKYESVQPKRLQIY